MFFYFFSADYIDIVGHCGMLNKAWQDTSDSYKSWIATPRFLKPSEVGHLEAIFDDASTGTHTHLWQEMCWRLLDIPEFVFPFSAMNPGHLHQIQGAGHNPAEVWAAYSWFINPSNLISLYSHISWTLNTTLAKTRLADTIIDLPITIYDLYIMGDIFHRSLYKIDISWVINLCH